MTPLPVIVGFGGYNASGRSSFHQGYRRTILESLAPAEQQETLVGLACMMNLVRYEQGHYVDDKGQRLDKEQVAKAYRGYILENTLVRKIGKEHFDVDAAYGHRDVSLESDSPTTFTISRRQVPNPVPENWTLETIDDRYLRVKVSGTLHAKIESLRVFEVQSAGTLPTGFDPASLYNSRFHPRGLQLAVLGASDAINSMGFSWQELMRHVAPDQVAVYAASGLGQADDFSIGGYMQARLKSGRPTSKQMALGLNSMPADFINAYVCGSVGTTGAMAGACATFLYNLRLAVEDIATGRMRAVICGSSEAPVTPEVIEGFAAMSALGTDEKIAKLDDAETADHRRASRPFGDNCGFTMAESSQYFVLMDDALAMQLGAQIFAAVPSVFVNADGFKKSISSPGAGNYITMAKCMAEAQSIVGEESIRERSFIQAHGSSTPQNRVTESIIFNRLAEAFEIKNWPVTAIKAFVGHPLGPASGDQLANALGSFADNIIPGIKTTEAVADDVEDDNLDILLQDQHAEMDVAFLNSKGFGGNNATAAVLSPKIVEAMLAKRYSETEVAQYKVRREAVEATAEEYNQAALHGDFRVIYNFGQHMIDESALELEKNELRIPEFSHAVSLNSQSRYQDML